MAQQLFANNAFSSLASTITNVATSITLATGHGSRFPTPTGGDHFLATLVGVDSNGNENSWEIVKVTTRSADVLTVVRGQEGSTALPWVAGSRIELRATSGTFAGLLQLAGGIVTGATTFSSGAYTALKVGITGLVSIGGEAGSSEAKLTVTDAGNVGLELSPTAIAGANRILSYNRASMAFAPMTLMALSHKFNVGGTDMVTVDSTGMSYTGTLTGGTGVVNLGSGQVYKDIYGNVGLNTTPSYLFDARSASSIVSRLQSTTSGAYLSLLDNGGVNGYVRVGAVNNDLVLMSGNNINGTLNSAGNFGLGVTPSAWASFYKSVDVAPYASFFGSEFDNAGVASNTYFNGTNWIYRNTAPASRYQLSGGAHAWFTAPSGTAGNPITFTQAMTLDASGVQTLSAPAAQQIIQPSSTTNNALTRYINGGGTAFVGLDNSSGGIGGAYSLNFWHNGAYPIIFGTSGVDRARIDTDGNLNINTTGAAGNRLYVVQSGTENVAARFQNSSNNFASNNIYSVLDGAGNATTAANHFVAFASGADVLAIRGNGNVVNTNNSYGAISDAKLKENIVDVTPKLAKLLQVRIVNYTLKADPNKTKLIGVIAQELEQISPGLIEETPDYEEVTKTREVEVPEVDAVLDEDGNEVTPAVPATTRTEEYTERVPTGTFTKSVKYSVFVPMLIKGMQEQQAQIESLKFQLDTQNTAMQLLVARLEALEAK